MICNRYSKKKHKATFSRNITRKKKFLFIVLMNINVHEYNFNCRRQLSQGRYKNKEST